jgi:hypothetical protein
MKLRRDTVGKMVEIAWRDPFRTTLRNVKADFADVEISEAAFPRQQERGVIKAIRNGIVVICHTECVESGLGPDAAPQYDVTYIPEDRVESVTIFEKAVMPEGGTNGG